MDGIKNLGLKNVWFVQVWVWIGSLILTVSASNALWIAKHAVLQQVVTVVFLLSTLLEMKNNVTLVILRKKNIYQKINVWIAIQVVKNAMVLIIHNVQNVLMDNFLMEIQINVFQLAVLQIKSI